ncbi:phage antirepressor N-terminal domain-containing protein [Mucilaginibacter sp.]|uniref:phage antirepressor N-terminal domain-containing protein n=1 Tax=Mucilaginibacter sp. TaxID=1882438 RepID=UPI002604A599|nr:phage antirepressor N-terminal domain-containing protein [Mucilaginibacter sp.]MDB4919859.1 hypothetical protein [Mucilaginibacter sp.]
MENQRKQKPQLNYLQEFNFEKTPILAGIVTTRELIALRPIVENLGLDWSYQLKKLKMDDAGDQLWSYAKVLSADNKPREMVCMAPFEFQNWLYEITPSDNMNIHVWSSYKKGLVLFIMDMLKTSLDEVLRLRGIETEFTLLKKDVIEYMSTDNEGKDASKLAKEKFKEAGSIKKRILDRMNNINPDQLLLL